MDNKTCRTCDRDFESWGDLADHINSATDKPHKRDRAGKMWAKRYIHRNTINKLKKLGRELPYRTPLTDEQREAKEDTRRELSGETKWVMTICPKCNKGKHRMIETEHVDEPEAWHIKNRLAVTCDGCR